MKKNRIIFVAAALAAFYLFTSIGHAHASESDLTPLPGNPLRKAVLDALRHEVKLILGLDVVFVVRHLKVKDGWAWAQTRPQSPDGANQYEDLSALLKLQEGVWAVAEIPCGEVENPNCIDGPDYFGGIRKRFPGVPSEIFPGGAD